jgi:hypothetical protein
MICSRRSDDNNNNNNSMWLIRIHFINSPQLVRVAVGRLLRYIHYHGPSGCHVYR